MTELIRDLTLADIKLNDPEDIGFRCRLLDNVDGLSICFLGADGEIKGGNVLIERLDDNRMESLRLIAQAICHALNAGTPYADIAEVVENMQQLATTYSLGMAEDWEALPLAWSLPVAYSWLNKQTGAVLFVRPDIDSEVIDNHGVTG